MILALNHLQLLSGSKLSMKLGVRGLKIVYFRLSMIKKLFFIGLVLGFALNSSAQKASANFKATYAASKQLLEQGNFGLAKQSFKSLLVTKEKNELVMYAQFYLGVSAYQEGDISYAKNVFLQLSIEQPTWNKIDAVYLWLSQIGFEQSGVFKGQYYADKITTEPYISKSSAFLKSQLQVQPLEVLEQLHVEYPKNEVIAEAYALALSGQVSSLALKSRLDSLIEEFSFDKSKFNSIPASVYKDQYKIGIMLPLYINRVEATGKFLKKSLAVDLYEGAKMAAYDVDSSLFKLVVYDTKKDSSQISTLLERGGFYGLDAVLGPIYPKTVAKMKQVALKEKMIFVNPTSSNPKISESSSYSFLLRASAAQLALKAAQYMKSQPINKNTFIYYGSSVVDSISAFVYKEAVESDSFTIVSMLKIGKDNRRDVYDILTASKTIVDRAKVARMTKEQIQRTLQLPTVNSLLIQPDSLGHIFIASSNPTVPIEAMSAIISRGDSIKIMGVGNWFESQTAAFGIMEGLGVTLAISSVDDVATLEYKALLSRYINTYKTHPSKYFFRGYYGMKMIAESLKKYGTYFQNGYRQHGNFDSKFDYENSNANGAIKIVKMVNNRIMELPIELEE